MGLRSRKERAPIKRIAGQGNFHLHYNDGWVVNDCVFGKIVLFGCWGIYVFFFLMWRILFPG